MAGDTSSSTDPGHANGSDENTTKTNPYETNPELIQKDDPFLQRSPHYGRYFPRDDDFKPRSIQWCQSDPDAVAYWEEFVRASWTLDNSLNAPDPREVFAAGGVLIRVDPEPAVDAAAERYSCVNANELSASRKAEDALKELGIAVPVVYFCGIVDGKNVSVESRIPGVSLEVVSGYLTTEQIYMFRQQCRRAVLRLRDTDSTPESPSYVCSGLNSQLPPGVEDSEKDILFQGKEEEESLCLVHNNMSLSNIIVDNDQVVGILGWRHSGYFGLGRADKIHREVRNPQTASEGPEEISVAIEAWNDLYENLPESANEIIAPQVKTEPSNMALEKVPLDEETEDRPTLAQLDGTDLPGEHPTPKKIANLKGRGASRASSSDRSSPANSIKPSTSKKSASAGTKKGVGRKPATKKRKLNDADAESVDGRRSNTPSSTRASKGPGTKKQGSASVAGSPAPEPKKRGKKKPAPTEEDEESEDENAIFCICRKPDNHTWMIACDGECDDWYHGKCVNIDPRDADLIDKYFCPNCKEKGQGWTTWKPICRMPGCRQPARFTRKPPSKYCTDEHGQEFMQLKTTHLDLSAEPESKKRPAGRTGFTNGNSSSAERETNGSHVENGVDAADGLANEPEDLGSRGGILTAGDLKAVITGVSSAEEFRKLGARIISPPPDDDEDPNTEHETKTKKKPKKLGLDVDPKDLAYSPDEATKIEELRKWRDELLHRREMLTARNTFVTLVRQRSKSIVERLKQNDPKGGWKDICGFDTRFAWSDEEFDEWRLSDPGTKALQDGTPESLATSFPDLTDADGDTAMDEEDEMASVTRGVCTKKRCERHKQWVKVQQQEILFEENTLEGNLTQCEKEAQNVVERAVLRMWAEKDNAQVGGQ